MRRVLASSGLSFRVAIGEGELDDAPGLVPGELIGSDTSGVWDFAVDPLEGTTLCAQGVPGAVTVIAAGAVGTILSAPDSYMRKVMAGPACPREAVHVDNPVGNLLRECAKGSQKAVRDLVVCVLDKPRHGRLVEQIRSAGASLKFISDGDVPAAIWVCQPERFGVDLYLGVGGSPEGVLSAAAIKSLGGSMSARFEPQDEAQERRLSEWSSKLNREALALEDMVAGEIVFAMSSVSGTPTLAASHRSGRLIRIETMTLSTLGPATSQPIFSSQEIDPGKEC